MTVHDPCKGLENHIVCPETCIGSLFAIGSQVHIDEIRPDLLECFVIDAQARRDLGPEIVKKNIAPFYEFVEDFLSFGGFDVKGNAPFAPVEGEEAALLPIDGGVCKKASRLISPDGFYLNDRGPLVGQQHGATRPCPALRKVHHRNPLKGSPPRIMLLLCHTFPSVLSS